MRRELFIFFMSLFCFIIFSGISFSKDSGIRPVKSSPNPGKVKLSQTDFRQRKPFSGRTVFTKHAAFLLDKAYVPQLQKKEGHILLQLTQPLDSSIKKKFKYYGVELLEYLPSNTWKAKIPAAVVHVVKDMDFVHAMGDIHPADKFTKHILERDFSPYSYHGDGTISILVSFHGDILFDRVTEILTDISGTTEQKDFITGQRVLLRISKDQVQTLAEYDEVNWIEDRLPPKKANNVNAAALSNIDDLLTAPYGLDGSGIGIGEWDEGEVQDDHTDFSSRVVIVDSASLSSHATHVAGTMIGNGSGSTDAKGMAPSALLYSYDFNGDVLAEMTGAVSTYGIELSNNSWNYIAGWEYNFYGGEKWVWFGDSYFGDYSSVSRAWDQTVVDTDLIIVNAAGNDRNDDGDELQDGHYHAGDSTTVYYCFHPPDGDYDCVGQIGSSKNIIAVGAVYDSGSMLHFSSWGPTDDGRVKPDIVANGYSLRSPCPTDTYCYKSGTSMSAPVVTGAIALIIERYVAVFGFDPSAAMVKALLTGSAIDEGNMGPDYSYGWGLLDAGAAVSLVDRGSAYLWEDNISRRETLEYLVSVPLNAPELKVTIAWTDPAGSPFASAALVNDIDLELVDPSSSIHSPWILDPANPSSPATTGINSVDNVEQVQVDSPETGVWTIRVYGASIQGSQSFALIVNQTDACTMTTFAAAYGSTSSDPHYSLTCDLEGDGDVDGSDLADMAAGL